MTEQDREKKIAEIRRRFELQNDNGRDHDLTNLDVQILLSELDSLRESIAEWKEELHRFQELAIKATNKHQEEWDKLIERLREESRKLLEENQTIKELEKYYFNKSQSLQEERDKLIEGLRWYADEKNYRREFHSRHGTLVEPADAIYYDCGQRARDILKEIGVTVE